MDYELFYKLISTEGFGRLSLNIHESNVSYIPCSLGVSISNYKLMYWLVLGDDELHKFDTLDEMLNEPLVFGKNLKDLWEFIEVIDINDCSEEEYLNDIENRFNIYEYKESIGELIWDYKPSLFQIYIYFIKYALIGIGIVNLVPLIIILAGGANWFLMAFFGIISLITFIIASIFGTKANANLHYYLTTKGINKEMGAMYYSAPYSNIKILKKAFNF